jgi:mono/diheme cytochrome c family protein
MTMPKSGIAVVIAGVLFSTVPLLSLTSDSVAQEQESGQDRGSAWWWNYWEPGSTEAWDLRKMSPEQRQRMMRHWTFMNGEVPEQYLNAQNDVGYTTSAIAEGGVFYEQNCLKCHGERGLGDGEAAGDLTPSPALLAYLVQQPIAVDQYLLWSISEGGKDFGTAMPAWKDTLSEDQIWKIIAYLRAGLPDVDLEVKGDATEATPEENKVETPSSGDETPAEPESKDE